VDAQQYINDKQKARRTVFIERDDHEFIKIEKQSIQLLDRHFSPEV
jgi:hypothetical protein